MAVDAFVRYLTPILQGRLQCQQREATSLVVAARLSAAIAASSSPLNLPYAHRERRRQLSLMESALRRSQTEIASERQRILHKRQALVERARELSDRFNALSGSQRLLASVHRSQLQHLSAGQSLSSLKLRLRRRKMLELLLTIYPLHVVPLNRRDPRHAMDPTAPDEYMIRGIRLPNVHLYQYEEQAATGFSYVCHLLLLIASLYSIAVRYRLVYRSSRSYVWDDIVTGTMFPLFWKGVERERFETAVSLLNKNIEQIRATVVSRGEGYVLPTLAPPGMMGGEGGTATEGGPGGGEGSSGGGGGNNKRGEHQTLENLKALLDILLPNDEN